MKEIKTIIMDLGGVYFTRGSYLAIEKLINIYDIKDRRSVWKFFSDSYEQEGRHIRLGLITMDEFEERFIKKYNIDESKLEYIRQIWFGSYVPHYGMHDLVLKLSKIYRLIVFSGNIRERVEFLDNRYGFLDHFDDTVFSFDYQTNKNSIDFYNILLNHINCKPVKFAE
ncbi:MAG: hypothetical protein P8Y97_21525 [Candidatus Lokiarchaeota archaeon]